MENLLSPSELKSLFAGPAATAARGSGLAPDLLRGLTAVHGAFAGEATSALGALLRDPVDVRLLAVESTYPGDYTGSAEGTVYQTLLDLQPLAAPWRLDLDAAVALALVDRLLGGTGADAPPLALSGQTLSAIELRLLGRIVDVLLAALVRSWSPICALTGTAQPLRLPPAATPLSDVAGPVVVRLEISVGSRQGPLDLVIPRKALQALKGKLAEYGRVASIPEGSVDRCREGSAPDDERVQVVASLATVRLPGDEVAGLAVGDVIVTECDLSQPIRVSINGKPVFLGVSGQYDGRKAVRISQRLPKNASGSPDDRELIDGKSPED